MPTSPKTHWKQSLFFIEAIQAEKDDLVKGMVHIKTDQDNYRNLNARFTYKIVGSEDS
jgi:hypothetical protein